MTNFSFLNNTQSNKIEPYTNSTSEYFDVSSSGASGATTGTTSNTSSGANNDETENNAKKKINEIIKIFETIILTIKTFKTNNEKVNYLQNIFNELETKYEPWEIDVINITNYKCTIDTEILESFISDEINKLKNIPIIPIPCINNYVVNFCIDGEIKTYTNALKYARILISYIKDFSNICASNILIDEDNNQMHNDDDYRERHNNDDDYRQRRNNDDDYDYRQRRNNDDDYRQRRNNDDDDDYRQRRNNDDETQNIAKKKINEIIKIFENIILTMNTIKTNNEKVNYLQKIFNDLETKYESWNISDINRIKCSIDIKFIESSIIGVTNELKNFPIIPIPCINDFIIDFCIDGKITTYTNALKYARIFISLIKKVSNDCADKFLIDKDDNRSLKLDKLDIYDNSDIKNTCYLNNDMCSLPTDNYYHKKNNYENHLSVGAIIASYLFIILAILWVIAGISGFIMSLICFGYNSINPIDNIIGLLLAIFVGPFYWIYYSYNNSYCNK